MKMKIKERFAQEILSYLSSSDEKLLYIGKPSGYTLVPKGIILGVGLVAAYIIIHYISLIFFSNILAFAAGLVVLLGFVLYLGAYVMLDWLFDFYIVTSRKIIDVHYAPPFSHNLSTILLDQVRCTEVDMQKNGLLHELFDIGDVTITFDRPTHQEAFTLRYINHPEQVSLYLGHALTGLRTGDTIDPFWFKSPKAEHKLQIGEDVSLLVKSY